MLRAAVVPKPQRVRLPDLPHATAIGSFDSILRLRRGARLPFVYLGLRDVDIGYAGRTASHKVHDAIRALRVGDPLRLLSRELVGPGNQVVGRLAQRCELPPGDVVSVTVTAIVPRSKAQVPEAAYRRLCRVDEWEIVLALVFVVPDSKKARAARASTAAVDSVQ